MDSSTKRFLAMMSAPLFLLLNGKLAAGVDPETSRLLLEVIAGYFIASKGGEAIIESARSKAAGASSVDLLAALARANNEGAKLTSVTTTATSEGRP